MEESLGIQKRIRLFETLGAIIKLSYNKGTQKLSFVNLNLGYEAPNGPGWDLFMERYFKDAAGVEKLFVDAKKVYRLQNTQEMKARIQRTMPKVDLTGDDPTNLFLYYACDIPSIGKVSYCSGKPDDLKDEEIIGDYTSDVEQIGDIRITTDNEFDGSTSKKLVVQIPKFIGSGASSQYSQMDLVSKGGGGYELKYKNFLIGNIQFDKDKNGFLYKILKINGAAKRKEFGVVKSTDTTNTKKDDIKPTETKPKIDEPRGTTLQNIKTVDNKTIKSHTCDDSMFEDGGFELGCKNKLIGDLNEKLFGDRMFDLYSEMLQNYLTSYSCFTQNNLSKKLNPYAWNRAMKIGTIKESVRKVLKEHINKKK
jgi:hypothetical protein